MFWPKIPIIKTKTIKIRARKRGKRFSTIIPTTNQKSLLYSIQLFILVSLEAYSMLHYQIDAASVAALSDYFLFQCESKTVPYAPIFMMQSIADIECALFSQTPFKSIKLQASFSLPSINPIVNNIGLIFPATIRTGISRYTQREIVFIFFKNIRIV